MMMIRRSLTSHVRRHYRSLAATASSLGSGRISCEAPQNYPCHTSGSTPQIHAYLHTSSVVPCYDLSHQQQQATRSLSTSAGAAAAAASDSDSEHERDAPQKYSTARRAGVRNVAIIAHVDHGKTTLVDKLLWTTHVGEEADLNRLMDSGELEQERGITITSKVTRLSYTSGGSDDEEIIINVVDTPGKQNKT